jgi:peptidyl-prolyl cis-trans isomerase C
MRALYGVQIPSSSARQDAFWRAAAKAMAAERVVARSAQDMGITVSVARANSALAQYVASVYGTGASGQSAFASALMTAGTSLPAVQAEFRRVLIDEELFGKVAGKASTPTSAQLQAGYLRWSCRLGTAESRHIQNIVVLDAATAATVKRELATGTGWNNAVSRWSQDATSAAKHGDIGWQRVASLQPAFANVAFAASPGVIFGPVQTTAGYDIGRVLAIKRAAAPTFAASAAQVSQWLQAEQQTQRWTAWIAKQTAAANIRYAPMYRPSAKTAAVGASSPLGNAVPTNCPAK